MGTKGAPAVVPKKAITRPSPLRLNRLVEHGGSASMRTVTLWYAGRCRVACRAAGRCPRGIPLGGEAGDLQRVPGPESRGATQFPAVAPPAGSPGGSTHRELECRVRKRDAETDAMSGGLHRFVRVHSGPSQATTAWARGADGEEVIAGILWGLAASWVYALHDRRIPGPGPTSTPRPSAGRCLRDRRQAILPAPE